MLFSILLYDDAGLWQVLFPDRTWMRRPGDFRTDLLLLACRARRLLGLALRRTL